MSQDFSGKQSTTVMNSAVKTYQLTHCMDIIIAHHPKTGVNGSALCKEHRALPEFAQSAHELLFTPGRLLFIVIYQAPSLKVEACHVYNLSQRHAGMQPPITNAQPATPWE